MRECDDIEKNDSRQTVRMKTPMIRRIAAGVAALAAGFGISVMERQFGL